MSIVQDRADEYPVLNISSSAIKSRRLSALRETHTKAVRLYNTIALLLLLLYYMVFSSPVSAADDAAR